MTVTRSSVPIRTNAFGMKTLADGCCAEASLLTPGRYKPISKPPLAATENFKNSRRSIPVLGFELLIGHLPSPPSRRPGGLPFGCGDMFHNDKYCPSWPGQYPHRWALVSC